MSEQHLSVFLDSDIFQNNEYYIWKEGNHEFVRKKVGGWINVSKFFRLIKKSPELLYRQLAENRIKHEFKSLSAVTSERYGGIWLPKEEAIVFAKAFGIYQKVAPILEFDRIATVVYSGKNYYEYFVHINLDRHVRILRDMDDSSVNMIQIFSVFKSLRDNDDQINLFERNFYSQFSNRGILKIRNETTICGGKWVPSKLAKSYAKKHGFYDRMRPILGFEKTPDQFKNMPLERVEVYCRQLFGATESDESFYRYPSSFSGGVAPPLPKKNYFTYKELVTELVVRTDVTRKGKAEKHQTTLVRRLSDGWVNASTLVHICTLLRMKELDLGDNDPYMVLEKELHYLDLIDSFKNEIVVSKYCRKINGKWCSRKDALEIINTIKIGTIKGAESILRFLEDRAFDGEGDKSDSDSMESDDEIDRIDESDFQTSKKLASKTRKVIEDNFFIEGAASSPEIPLDLYGDTEKINKSQNNVANIIEVTDDEDDEGVLYVKIKRETDDSIMDGKRGLDQIPESSASKRLKGNEPNEQQLPINKPSNIDRDLTQQQTSNLQLAPKSDDTDYLFEDFDSTQSLNNNHLNQQQYKSSDINHNRNSNYSSNHYQSYPRNPINPSNQLKIHNRQLQTNNSTHQYQRQSIPSRSSQQNVHSTFESQSPSQKIYQTGVFDLELILQKLEYISRNLERMRNDKDPRAMVGIEELLDELRCFRAIPYDLLARTNMNRTLSNLRKFSNFRNLINILYRDWNKQFQMGESPCYKENSGLLIRPPETFDTDVPRNHGNFKDNNRASNEISSGSSLGQSEISGSQQNSQGLTKQQPLQQKQISIHGRPIVQSPSINNSTQFVSTRDSHGGSGSFSNYSNRSLNFKSNRWADRHKDNQYRSRSSNNPSDESHTYPKGPKSFNGNFSKQFINQSRNGTPIPKSPPSNYFNDPLEDANLKDDVEKTFDLDDVKLVTEIEPKLNKDLLTIWNDPNLDRYKKLAHWRTDSRHDILKRRKVLLEDNPNISFSKRFFAMMTEIELRKKTQFN